MQTILSFEQLLDGYEKTIVTGHRLLMAAMGLLGDYPEVALGLAELGQEEIGKSLSFLAAFKFDSSRSKWKWFWSAWKNHQTKAHRAYLYELVFPVRIDVLGPDGSTVPLPSLRDKMSEEKESSFYVNFDANTRTFVSPEDNVKTLESGYRVLTLLYLATTARSVALSLKEQGSRFAYSAFGDIALRICSTDLFQQDMPAAFKEFEQRSREHSVLVVSLRKHLSEGKRSLIELTGREIVESEEGLYP